MTEFKALRLREMPRTQHTCDEQHRYKKSFHIRSLLRGTNIRDFAAKSKPEATGNDYFII